MLLGGLWHGANWTFVLWGMWHGGWLCLERVFGPDNRAGFRFTFLPWLSTLFIVLMGWVAFRADTFTEAFAYYGALFSGNFDFSAVYADSISRMQLYTLALAWLIVVLFGLRSLHPAHAWPRNATAVSLAATPALAALFAISVLKLSTQSYTPFLYFQF